FIDWTLANELTELSFSRLQLAKESLNQTKKRVKVNLSEKIDLLRAEYAMQFSYQNWQTYQARLKSTQFKIASRFDDLLIRQKTPRFNLYDYHYIKKPDYIVVEKLRSVRSINLNQTILERQLALSQSKRNGSLNVIGSYEFLGGDNNFQGATQFLKNNASLTLQYSRFLSDVESITNVKKIQQNLNQFELNKNRLIRDLTAEIIALYTLINEYKSVLDINLNQINISQEKATAEQRLFQQGRTSLDMLIQAQDNVLSSKTNYAQLSAEYQKYTLTYLALTDELLTNYGISL
ncbi:MAG: TolC family protein, partial [Candidatus Margulisiibacteriota bacterium]